MSITSLWKSITARKQWIVLGVFVLLLVAVTPLFIFKSGGLVFPKNINQDLKIVNLETRYNEGTPQLVQVIGQTNLPAAVVLKLNSSVYKRGKTDDEGKFEFKNVIVSPGKIEIEVSASRVFRGRVSSAYQKQSSLLAAGQIWGKIRSSEGQIKDAKVNISKKDVNNQIPVEVNEDSTFFSPDLPSGKYVVQVEASGFKKLEAEIELNQGNGYKYNGDFILELNNATASPRVEETQQDLSPYQDKEKNVYRIFYYDALRVPPPSKRSVEASIKYRSLTLKLQGTLSSNDKRLDLLNCPDEERAQCLPQFVRSIFNDFSVNSLIYQRFATAPNRTLTDTSNPTAIPDKDNPNLINFSLESRPEPDSFTNTINQDWKITTDWRAKKNKEDSFHLKLENYERQNRDPRPSYISDEKHDVTWENTKDFSPTTIEVPFNYQFNGLSALGRLLWTLPYDLVPADTYLFLYYIRGVLLVIPIVWLLWLLKKHPELNLLDQDFSQRFQRVATKLIVVPLIEPVIHIVRQTAAQSTIITENSSYWAIGLQKTVNYLLKAAPNNLVSQDDIRVLLISVTIVIIISGLLLLIVLPIRERCAGFWIMNILRGTFYAALVVLTVLVLSGLALLVLPSDIVGLSKILATVLAWGFLVWLIHSLYFYRAYLKKGIIKTLVVLLILIWLFIAAFPSSPLELFHSIFTPNYDIESSGQFIAVHDETLEYLRAFFQNIQHFVPYLALMGLALLLKKRDKYTDSAGSNSQDEASGEPSPAQVDPISPDIFQRIVSKLGLIIFAAFLVGTQLTWLLLPLPFIIALFTFRFVFAPEKRREAIDSIISTVDKDRPGWKDHVLSMFQVKADEKRLKSLEKRYSDSEILEDEYKAEKKKIEEEIANQPCETKLKADRDRKDVIKIKDTMLGIGPEKTNWGNAARAIRYGIRLALPLTLISGVNFWTNSEEALRSYRLLATSSQFLLSLAYWLTAAFFFGYFFNYINGKTGLIKSAYVSACAVIPMAFSTTGLSNFSPYAIAGLYFFAGLGLWAFDHCIFKQIFDTEFKWKTFLKIENSPSPGSITSLITAGIGTVISGIIVQVITFTLIYMFYKSLPPWFKT
jgi:Family of unknown function (DUF6185)